MQTSISSPNVNLDSAQYSPYISNLKLSAGGEKLYFIGGHLLFAHIVATARKYHPTTSVASITSDTKHLFYIT